MGWPTWLRFRFPATAWYFWKFRGSGRLSEGLFLRLVAHLLRSWAEQQRARGQRRLSYLPVGKNIGTQKRMCSPEVLCYGGAADTSSKIWLKTCWVTVWQKRRRRRTDGSRTYAYVRNPQRHCSQHADSSLSAPPVGHHHLPVHATCTSTATQDSRI